LSVVRLLGFGLTFEVLLNPLFPFFLSNEALLFQNKGFSCRATGAVFVSNAEQGRTPNVSKEDFQLWFKSRSRFPLAIKGHSFTLSRDGLVKVDGGKFVYEEALQLVSMLNSRSPFTQMNATLVIWERNGALRLVVVALLVIVAAAVLVIASR
jgi:hypothetical protein